MVKDYEKGTKSAEALLDIKVFFLASIHLPSYRLIRAHTGILRSRLSE